MPDYTIAINDLLPLIGTPDAPHLIDVCVDEDFANDPRLIPGARRWPFARIGELAPELSGPAIIICQKGLKLGQGAAAWLRTEGVDAKYLTGGKVAWAAEGLPAIPFEQHPGEILVSTDRPTLEDITSHWMLKRFVAPRARILTVEAAQVANAADRFTGYAVPNDPNALSQTLGLGSLLMTTLGALTGPERPGLAAILQGAQNAEAFLPVLDALFAAKRPGVGV